MKTEPANIKLGVGGFFKFEAIRPDGEVRVLADWFPNLVTNTGMDSLASTTNAWFNCKVGTGSTTPTVTDTALAVLLATTDTQQSSTEGAAASSPYYGYSRVVWEFGTGVAAGNLTEVGVFVNNTSTMFSRALILDGVGSPTTITVLSDETLQVTYEFRIYAPLTDASFSLYDANSATTYTGVVRASNVTDWGFTQPRLGANNSFAYQQFVNTGTIGAITGFPSGSFLEASACSQSSYTAGSYTLNIISTWSLAYGNGTITAAWLLVGQLSAVRFQMSFSPSIAKTSSKVLVLTLTITWARH